MTTPEEYKAHIERQMEILKIEIPLLNLQLVEANQAIYRLPAEARAIFEPELRSLTERRDRLVEDLEDFEVSYSKLK